MFDFDLKVASRKVRSIVVLPEAPVHERGRRHVALGGGGDVGHRKNASSTPG